MKLKSFLFFILLPCICGSQVIKGKIIDKATKQPLETVAVYFDNTTIGTTTDEKGEFSISYTEAIQSTLVISYLGYEKVLISDFRNQNNITIEMVEADNELDEVLIEYDDGLTRKQKLRLFKKEFLGSSTFGKSCTILNEDDIILNYDKQDRTLHASARVPIVVKNKALQYEVNFDVKDFEIEFRYVDPSINKFVLKKVAFQGTSFYKNLEKADRKKTLKNREKAYKGSIQHFMRSLYKENIRDEGYRIFSGKFMVNEWAHFRIEKSKDSSYKKVVLKDKVSILYDKKFQSSLEVLVPEFFVNSYGYYLPILGVYFSGEMGSQRLGDMLPFDYELKD
ncbi:carboxypeptidase-like regulatory domain-containing protein [Winogradskyella luteola]|uniref:Carboxypeptidase-like regulatory domain-containing protein n=1 Tax=Winogradskyella luteola TaxID=2828330 RepID=A0A9X1JRV9_9FLAO|nr:carboxypeptidase-like regulatory domain-containing protein [Winogradskyella luteola]MBV7269002.1 carboxypeptidase-like regulatory domain-containing protein [Winogradskyella luteola]